MTRFSTVGGAIATLLFIFSTNLKSQTDCPDIDDPFNGTTVDVQPGFIQKFSFDRFMGINTLRDNPIEEANCVGFVREYHTWNTDEGNVLIPNQWTNEIGSQPYPNQLFRWNPVYQNTTPTQFDYFYQTLNGQGLEVGAAMMNTPYVYSGIQSHPDWPDDNGIQRRPYQDIPPLFHKWEDNLDRFIVENCNNDPADTYDPFFDFIYDC